MKKLMHIMLLVFCVIFIASCNNGEHEGKIYETSVDFIASKISGVVGDEFNLNSLLVLKPYNASLEKIEISNESVASFVENENKIVCLSHGQTIITAKVNCKVNGEKSASFTLTVSKKAIYATQLTFESENVELNFDESVTNVPTFTLSSGEIVSYGD